MHPGKLGINTSSKIFSDQGFCERLVCRMPLFDALLPCCFAEAKVIFLIINNIMLRKQ